MSKQVTDRRKNTTALTSIIHANTEGLQNALAEVLKEYLDAGEVIPDIALLLALLQRRVDAQMKAAEEADHIHTLELSDDLALLQQRDEQVAALYRGVTQLRESMAGVFGADVLPGFGFKGSTPQEPIPLIEYTRNITALIRKGTLPPPKEEDISYNPTKRLASLDELQKLILNTLQELAKEKREAQETMVTRDRAVERFDATYSSTANVLAALFTLAGLPELAERVRPSTRRSPSPEPPTGPAPTPTPGPNTDTKPT